MSRVHEVPSGLALQTLLVVAELDDAAFGLSIRHEVSSRTDHDYSVGAIYTTLSRLETKGLVTSGLTEPLPVRGGRARKQFMITEAGHRALASARRQAQQLWQPATAEGS
ncbi:PadR family transcriptional regulator [Propionibacteriaceae bacterium Y1685]|uniref:PadR family transcriptional regulator n=1 Tax=Microlunatus sp. Y1700 TaxID=3418487 RepID=UPI003B7C28FB